MFLNFHTHQNVNIENQQVIFNQIIPENEEDLENFILAESNISLGIHPWFINENWHKFQIQILEENAHNQQVKLIGECGLDRQRGVSLHLQEEIFIKQIRIAEEVRKPLVIHCVGCFSELLSIKKIIRPKIPLVVHGFNQNIEIGKQLLQKDFYFSLGEAILKENSNAQKLLEILPIEKLFLETDNKEISIESIYQKVADIKQIEIIELEEKIFNNFVEISI